VNFFIILFFPARFAFLFRRSDRLPGHMSLSSLCHCAAALRARPREEWDQNSPSGATQSTRLRLCVIRSCTVQREHEMSTRLRFFCPLYVLVRTVVASGVGVWNPSSQNRARSELHNARARKAVRRAAIASIRIRLVIECRHFGHSV